MSDIVERLRGLAESQRDTFIDPHKTCEWEAAAEIESLREDRDALVEAIVAIIAGWESLPGPKMYTASQVAEWIQGPMLNGIQEARTTLARIQEKGG